MHQERQRKDCSLRLAKNMCREELTLQALEYEEVESDLHQGVYARHMTWYLKDFTLVLAVLQRWSVQPLSPIWLCYVH